ncbi:manganese efflux pump, partial [Methanosphaera stadtmanae]|uniref:manganese efflux pump n=1 Tax=Methanosphaera stadtmanae TaxID=2317 RepID=UPI0026660F7A
ADIFSFKEVTLLAIATSIDAFAVGVTFAILNISLVIPCAIIGIITFLFSIVGVFIGKKLGDYFGDKFQILGGVILILLGFKILLGF